MTCSENPFIPGITLSIRLVEAAKQASEGERRAITDIRVSIDELLLEILERLPQTVRDFEGGMKGCTNMFDPLLMRSSGESNGLGGPMDMIISKQQQLQTFCEAPLFMDFLSSKFTLGLPDLNDTAGVLRNIKLLGSLEARCLTLEDGWGLQGGGEDFPENRASQTFLPGAQFIVAGLVATPINYYSIPAMRMLLDFVAYIGMVTVLSYFVLFHTANGSVAVDDGIVGHSFSFSEGLWAAVFITVSIV